MPRVDFVKNPSCRDRFILLGFRWGWEPVWVVELREVSFNLDAKQDFFWGRGELFRRYFFVWFVFFCFLISLTSVLTLYDRWKSDTELVFARAQSLTAQCLHEFRQREDFPDRPERWEWEDAYRRWAANCGCLLGIALEDRADSRILFTAGETITETGLAGDEAENAPAKWVTLDSGHRFWTVLPAGEKNPRFRLWLNFGSEKSFRDFLHDRRFVLGGEALFFTLVFVLFYWRIGNPGRHLAPIVATLQRALEHADSPLQVPPSSMPGEFQPLAKSVSLILESRRIDHQERVRLDQKQGHHLRQKDHYTRMVKTLKSNRENEQSVVERIQQSLLETNREPVILLDRTRRILAMNEPALKALSLSGQTGYPLRHSELEENSRPGVAVRHSPGDHRLTVRDPYLKRTTHWRVHVSKHYHWNDPAQIQCIILSLKQETTGAEATTQSTESLLRLLAGAWAENFSQNSPLPAPLNEEEKRRVDILIRHLLAVGQAHVEVPGLLEDFGLGGRGEFAPDAEFGEVGGSAELWRAFSEWIAYLIGEMSPGRITVEVAGMTPSRVKIEWNANAPFAFPDWFGDSEDKTTAFRRELLQRSLEKIRAKVAWHPSMPKTFSLEIHLKARLVPGRRASGLPLRMEA